MIIKSKHMNRRTLLRGLGTAMSLPLLEAMLPSASAADLAARPKRLQALYSPNGMIMERFTPETVGLDFALTPTLEPFAAFKDRMTVVTGLAHLSGRGTHSQGCAGFLSAAEPRPTEGADLLCGVSIDQIVARKYENETLMPSLELGVETAAALGSCNPGYSCAYTNTLSWRDETSPLPVTINPREVFERMFGDGDVVEGAARLARQDRKASLLDFVREDAARLSGKLGSNDRQKMDQYLTAVRDVERRMQMANQSNVDEFAAGVDVPAGVPANFAEHVKLMFDLQVIAMQTDMTRVGSFMIGRELSNRTYQEIGVPDSHHMLTHHQADPEKFDRVAMINRLHMQHFAYLLKQLAATPDGEGSLLDSTLVLVGAGFGDPNSHDLRNLPAIVFGGKRSGGQHIRVAANTSKANLLLSLVHQFDIPMDSLADSTGIISELLPS